MDNAIAARRPGAPPRIAILSDLHLDSDVSACGYCARCMGIMHVCMPCQVKVCPCGASSLVAGVQCGFECKGDGVAWPDRRQWGRMVRNQGADLVLVLGDICRGPQAVHWVAQEFKGIPVVMIAGNREYYGGDIAGRVGELMGAAQGYKDLEFLECTTACYNLHETPVRILGATLWTDFNALESRGIGLEEAMAYEDMRMKARQANPELSIGVEGGQWSAAVARSLHLRTRGWIEEQLSQPFDGYTILATHHGPVLEAASDSDTNTPGDAAFYSDLGSLVLQGQPDLVVWGHTHGADVDMRMGRTRLFSHQRGYCWEADRCYGPAIVELGMPATT